MKSLRCVHLFKSYGGVHALADVDIVFPSSGIVGVIGPNGAGKTTLLNVLSGFLPADNGQCFLNDQEITRLSPYRIARLGIARTFQELRLVRQVSVLENLLVSFPHQRGEHLLNLFIPERVKRQEERNRVEAFSLLEFVGLENIAFELAGEISYGQQKLLTLACCLATNPDILLLDEPVAGVHPNMASRIMTILCQIRDRGKLVVLIEHDIALVRHIADVAIVMDEGRVVAQGSPDVILSRTDVMEIYFE